MTEGRLCRGQTQLRTYYLGLPTCILCENHFEHSKENHQYRDTIKSGGSWVPFQRGYAVKTCSCRPDYRVWWRHDVNAPSARCKTCSVPPPRRLRLPTVAITRTPYASSYPDRGCASRWRRSAHGERRSLWVYPLFSAYCAWFLQVDL